MLRVALIYDRLTDNCSPDGRDVIDQINSVAGALERLGHQWFEIPCDLDLLKLKRSLEETRPDLVFNLVESLSGQGRLIHLVPSMLDFMGIPYTGSSTEAIFLSSNKVISKVLLDLKNIPTPRWIGPYPPDFILESDNLCSGSFKDTAPWIIKSLWEHASIGLDEGSVVSLPGDGAAILQCLREHAPRLGGSCFAEKYIDGREFNLSILACSGSPRVLPPAEIIFKDYDEKGYLHIVDYKAKWDRGSFEYHNTPRNFDFPLSDAPLLASLESIALRCWKLFRLGGYARVDFRVDSEGNPWVLEINVNPCISPDGGFAAAVERSGLTFIEAVSLIIQDAIGRCPNRQSALSVKSEDKSGKPCEQILLNMSSEVHSGHVEEIKGLVRDTGFFSPEEIDIAVELVEERLLKGDASGYFFVFAYDGVRLAGYTCYGPIAGTASSYDLYWIAVHPDYQKRGIGLKLLNETEKLITQNSGSRIYVDTSNRLLYSGTRAFYMHSGYRLSAVLDDFYNTGDGKAIYCKQL